jgi:hypothetical protein
MMFGFHSLYLVSLLVILVVVFAPVIAVIVLVVLNRRRAPILSGPALTQTPDGRWISADGQWEWDGQAWVRRSEGPPGSKS